MRKKTKIAGATLALVAMATGAFLAFQGPIARTLFERVVDRTVGVDRSAGLADGLHVYVCGSGSPMLDPDRAGPCLGVLAGRRAFIFDVGSGSIRKLGRMGFPIARTEGLFLTHLHSDHIDGLGELMVQSWIPEARSTPLPVYGPPGTVEVVGGFNAAYRIDSTYRTAHHGAAVANPAGFGLIGHEIVLPQRPASEVVLEEGDLRITAIRVSHEPIKDAYAYRIDYKGRSISLSGDTAFDRNFARASAGVDVMFHEALEPRMVKTMQDAATRNAAPVPAKVLADIPGYHTSPPDAGRIAALAKARALVFYHTVPPLPSRLFERLFLEGVGKAFAGDFRIAEDGLLISLPAGSASIEYDELL